MSQSEVVLAQNATVEISTAFCADVEITPEPAMASLESISRDVQYQGGSADEIDVTTLGSTAKEFRLGLEDSGTFAVSGHWVQGNAAHKVIKTAAGDKKTRLIKITFEDGSTFKCLALVSQRSWAAAASGVVSGTFNFRLTGPVAETDPI